MNVKIFEISGGSRCGETGKNLLRHFRVQTERDMIQR